MMHDRKGNEVCVGSLVRVLEVPDLENSLEPEEWAQIQSMRGDVLKVYDIDEYGSIWVEKWWHDGLEFSSSHSISLAPTDIELETG